MTAASENSSMERHPDQSPYHWRTLTHACFFCNYCRDNGVPITEEILEQLHKLGILFPALRIEHGIVEGTDEDGKSYYEPAGLFADKRDDWVAWYKERKMTFLPTVEPFIPWERGRDNDHARYRTKEEAGFAFTYLYDERQLYAVKIALERWKFFDYRPNEPLCFEEGVRNRVREYNAFLRFFDDVEAMHQTWKAEAHMAYNRFLAENEDNERDATKDWKANYKSEQLPKLHARAEEIATLHGMDLVAVKGWRSFLAQQSVLNELWPRRSTLQHYLRGASERTLIHAEASNAMIRTLNEYIRAWKNIDDSVRDVLLSITEQDARSCIQCGTLFKHPRNIKNPKFCCKRCKKEYDAEQKRLKRKRKKGKR